jgi:hypothetical protein
MQKTALFSKRFIVLILLCLETTFVSCKNKITKIELINKNPIEYIFKSSKDSLYKLITSQFNLKDLSLLTIERRIIMPSEVSEMFSQQKNNLDIFLWSIGVYRKSKIYKEKGVFFDYWVSFYLHLEQIDQKHTKVNIITIEPKIIVGKEWFPGPPHFVRNNKTIIVEPSTIEEYEILQEIGRLIGEQNMPSLILPDAKSPRITIK